MKKTSKILSLLVALCMAVTMLSGLTVFAADPFEVVSIDADADYIMIDFDQAILVDGDSGFVLTKEGEYVDFTVTKPVHKTVCQTTYSDYYTYVITPEGGMEPGATYKLTLWDVKSSDEVSTHAQVAYEISVEELANFDNFIPFKSQDAAKSVLTKDEEAGIFTIDNATVGSYSSSYVGGIAAVIGADAEAGLTFKNVLTDPATADSGADAWTEGDYTFKVTYTQGAGVKTERIIVGIGHEFGTNFYNTANYKYTGFYMEKNSTYTATAAAANVEAMDGAGSGASVRVLTGSNRQSGYAYLDANGNGMEVKFTIKDGIAKGFVNDKKVFDFTTEREVAGYPFIQVHQKASANSETAVAYTISNPVVTRANVQTAAEIDTPEGYVPPAPPEPEEPEEEEYPELINGWDADLNVFTVDFTEEVQAFDATVTQAGTIIPATVSREYYANKTTGTYQTWMIKPAAGFTRDIPYTVTISNVKNADASKKISTWSKTFKVEVLAEGLSLTDGSVTTKTNKTTIGATFTNEGDDLIISAHAQSSSSLDTSYIYVGKTLDSGEKEADYTINVTLTDFSSNIGYTQGFIGILSNTMTASYNSDHKSLNGALHYAKLGASATSNACYSNIRISEGNGTTNTQYGPGNFATIKFRGTNPVPVQLKLSVKNGVVSTYFNGKKTADVVTEKAITGAPQLMINLRSLTDATTMATVKYSDFVATRAVHADVLGDSFTAEEPEVAEGAIAENDVINVSAVVTNNTLEAKAIFAMCALYDAAGAMKNIVIAPVETADSGETTINFANVDTNGATYAKVFIWDDAETLNPWFPAITIE